MKRGLWGVLEVFGGIKAYRPEDIGGAADRKERRAETYRARAANQRLQDYLDGKPRGTDHLCTWRGWRYQDAMNPLQKVVVEYVGLAQDRLDMQVPLIPNAM